MSMILHLGEGQTIVVSGGTERKPAVVSISVTDENNLVSKTDIVDFGHRRRGYVCESSSPSEPVTAIKGRLVELKHQLTGRTFLVGGGD